MRNERPNCETTGRCVLPPLGMLWVDRTRCMFCKRVIVEAHIASGPTIQPTARIVAPTQAEGSPLEPTGGVYRATFGPAATEPLQAREPQQPLVGPRTNPAVRIRFETSDGMRYYVREAVAHDGLDFTSYRLADVDGYAHKIGDGWLVVLSADRNAAGRSARMQVQFLEEWLQELINLRDKAQPAQPGDAGDDNVPTPTE